MGWLDKKTWGRPQKPAGLVEIMPDLWGAHGHEYCTGEAFDTMLWLAARARETGYGTSDTAVDCLLAFMAQKQPGLVRKAIRAAPVDMSEEYGRIHNGQEEELANAMAGMWRIMAREAKTRALKTPFDTLVLDVLHAALATVNTLQTKEAPRREGVEYEIMDRHVILEALKPEAIDAGPDAEKALALLEGALETGNPEKEIFEGKDRKALRSAVLASRWATKRAKPAEIAGLIDARSAPSLFNNPGFGEQECQAVMEIWIRKIFSDTDTRAFASDPQQDLIDWGETFFRHARDKGYSPSRQQMHDLREKIVFGDQEPSRKMIGYVSCLPEAATDQGICDTIIIASKYGDGIDRMIRHAKGEAWKRMVGIMLRIHPGSEIFIKSLELSDQRNLEGLGREAILPLVAHGNASIRKEGLRLAKEVAATVETPTGNRPADRRPTR